MDEKKSLEEENTSNSEAKDENTTKLYKKDMQNANDDDDKGENIITKEDKIKLREERKKRRKNKSSKTLILPDIILTSDFETGNGRDFKEYDKDIYGFYPEKDPGTLYSGQAYYFKFKVENRLIRKQDVKKITVTAIADYDNVWKGWEDALQTKLWKYSMDGSITHLNPKFVKPTRFSIGINLVLKPKEKFYISNMLTIPYTEMEKIVLDISEIYPTETKLERVGKSPMGNFIYSLKIHPKEEDWNFPNKIKLLISGSAQSNEFGDYAAINLLRRYLKQGPSYWNEFKKHFNLQFLFFQNPDGIIEGKNMVNARGENIFFGYDIENEDIPQECEFIWEYLREKPPDFYLEYHSFFQYRKTIRPYIYPNELFKSAEYRKIYKKISKELIALSNGAKEIIKLGQKWFSSTLAYQLQKNYNTLSFQYKLHSCMTQEANWEIAWKVFEKSTKILKKNKDLLSN
ncbi:MAG: M14 family zinc carboxypeptidase [Promethearchaeota archaeon]